MTVLSAPDQEGQRSGIDCEISDRDFLHGRVRRTRKQSIAELDDRGARTLRFAKHCAVG